MKWAVATLLAATLLAGVASAKTAGGVTFPDTIQVDGKTLVLNGMGARTYTVLGIRGYVAGLYLEHPSHDARAIESDPGIKVILLQYLRSASKEQVEHQYREGQQVNCGAGQCPQSDAADYDRLIKLAPAVRPGDTSTYIIRRSGLQVLSNNQPLATFNNPDLGFRILEGFIGPRPPSEDLKAALLGQG
ncbi:MAG: chalcone isomerase family protein [Acetobacteraceae bacterium]|nr:chalcone isomerase family protein [Acetobacteraceae bacterium]MBV8522795.1 chalcone isomerase family protein [Acetobacteraceae bacterium]MBV8590056.1 chalcone isomerase family protein [Acetobacteraceae bacterium]